MKRLLMLLLPIVLCAGLAACADSKDTMSFDSFRNVEKGVTISLGMSREDVEDLLGEGKYLEPVSPFENQTDDENIATTNDSKFQYVSYGVGKDYIALTYENDIVGGISTSIIYEVIDIGPSNWCVKYGLTYGNTSEDVIQHCGENESRDLGQAVDGGKYSLLEYYYDASGNRLDEYYNCSNLIMFVLDESKNIYAIGVYDTTPESSYLPSDSENESE